MPAKAFEGAPAGFMPHRLTMAQALDNADNPEVGAEPVKYGKAIRLPTVFVPRQPTAAQAVAERFLCSHAQALTYLDYVGEGLPPAQAAIRAGFDIGTSIGDC